MQMNHPELVKYSMTDLTYNAISDINIFKQWIEQLDGKETPRHINCMFVCASMGGSDECIDYLMEKYDNYTNPSLLFYMSSQSMFDRLFDRFKPNSPADYSFEDAHMCSAYPAYKKFATEDVHFMMALECAIIDVEREMIQYFIDKIANLEHAINNYCTSPLGALYFLNNYPQHFNPHKMFVESCKLDSWNLVEFLMDHIDDHMLNEILYNGLYMAAKYFRHNTIIYLINTIRNKLGVVDIEKILYAMKRVYKARKCIIPQTLSKNKEMVVVYSINNLVYAANCKVEFEKLKASALEMAIKYKYCKWMIYCVYIN